VLAVEGLPVIRKSPGAGIRDLRTQQQYSRAIIGGTGDCEKQTRISLGGSGRFCRDRLYSPGKAHEMPGVPFVSRCCDWASVDGCGVTQPASPSIAGAAHRSGQMLTVATGSSRDRAPLTFSAVQTNSRNLRACYDVIHNLCSYYDGLEDSSGGKVRSGRARELASRSVPVFARHG